MPRVLLHKVVLPLRRLPSPSELDRIAQSSKPPPEPRFPRPRVYPSSQTIAMRGSVASITISVATLTARPIRSALIDDLDMRDASFRACAVARFGLLTATSGSMPNERIKAVSGQFGNAGHRTHSFQIL